MIGNGDARTGRPAGVGRRALFTGAAAGVAGTVVAADWYNVVDSGAVGDGAASTARSRTSI